MRTESPAVELVAPAHRRIADVGGGHGHLIGAILATHHDLTGVLFELPHVVDEVEPSSRLEVVAGDFFTDPLPSCDAYLLMNIVHDWDDQKASGILTAVAKSGEPGAAVLVVETVMPEGPEPHWAKTLDVLMLAVTGGRERTEAQYRRLLGERGHRLDANGPHGDAVLHHGRASTVSPRGAESHHPLLARTRRPASVTRRPTPARWSG